MLRTFLYPASADSDRVLCLCPGTPKGSPNPRKHLPNFGCTAYAFAVELPLLLPGCVVKLPISQAGVARLAEQLIRRIACQCFSVEKSQKASPYFLLYFKSKTTTQRMLNGVSLWRGWMSAITS